ncbi:MAG: hypothetical protein EOP49_14805 [Sphingobacteriales bacterium]|nr:MAG: hypothetical protein EOP49_14805 [Sphingobacteriales bacterium]
MTPLPPDDQHIHYVGNFEELVATPFSGSINAICWNRVLTGDFAEVVAKIALSGNITEVGEEEILKLKLSEQGQLAREVLLEDLKLLQTHGALPVLNVIQYYERDNTYPFFPTDVYSFHVDRSPIPTNTFLCTYYGATSEILPNEQGQQKVLIPEIRDQLRKVYHEEGEGDETDEGFEAFLSEYCFDLHYQATPGAQPISLSTGQLWRLAVDHPESEVLPCLHRAPVERSGELRLLMIC